jgi:hypothetical protein
VSFNLLILQFFLERGLDKLFFLIYNNIIIVNNNNNKTEVKMKKVLLASLVLMTVVSIDVMAKRGEGKRGFGKPTFTNGCLVVDANVKGPMADVGTKADADANGCVSEDEFKTYMKNNKPEGKFHNKF